MDNETPQVIGPALQIINQLEEEGLLKQPTIGGSLALMYYAQPMYTEDMEVFFNLVGDSPSLRLEPIYARLEELGCTIDGMYVNIEHVDVQLLGPGTGVTAEAMQHAETITAEGVPTHILTYEYAMAVKAAAGRSKDWVHITSSLEATQPDRKKLFPILQKYGLLDKWKKVTGDE